MDRLNYVNIKQEGDEDLKEVSMNNEKKQLDNEGSPRYDNTSLLRVCIKQKDNAQHDLSKNAQQQNDGSSFTNDNTVPLNVCIKQEFDDDLHKEVLIDNAQQQQNSIGRCTKVKKEEEGVECKVEWDGDECDCLECRVEREIKIEFNQTNATANQRVNLPGPSNANKGASQQCKRVKKDEEGDDGEEWDEDCDCGQCRKMREKIIRQEQTNATANQRVNLPGPSNANKVLECKLVKKKKNEEDDCEYIGLWDKDCGCKRCTRNRNKSIELNQTNATGNKRTNSNFGQSEAMDDSSCGHSIQASKHVDQNKEGAQDCEDSDDVERGEYDANDCDEAEGDVDVDDLVGNVEDCEDGVELDEEGDHVSDESEDNETEIDDEEYEMDVDGEESSDDEETEVDEQSDREPGDQSSDSDHRLEPNMNHTRNKKFKCTWKDCSKTFLKPCQLSIHIKSHKGEKDFKCTWTGCDKAYLRKIGLDIHYMTHTGEYPYTCEQCGKGLSSQFLLSTHMLSHTGERPYKCPWKECDKTFADKGNLKAHQMIHTQVPKKKPFKCPWKGCDKAFVAKTAMKNHQRFHTREKPFKCSWKGCEMAFAIKGSMKVHYKVHAPELLNNCEHCGKGFQTLSRLTEHIRTHTGEKPIKCLWLNCDKTFSTKGNMLNHHRIHTGEKPFKCSWNDCDKAFTEQSQMKRHYKSHTGEKPFICPSKGCDKAFAKKKTMQNHQVVHTGEKPFKCTWKGCKKAYAYHPDMWRHQKVHSLTN